MRERKVLETSLALILLYFREIAQGYTNPVFVAMELSALTWLSRAAPPHLPLACILFSALALLRGTAKAQRKVTLNGCFCEESTLKFVLDPS